MYYVCMCECVCTYFFFFYGQLLFFRIQCNVTIFFPFHTLFFHIYILGTYLLFLFLRLTVTTFFPFHVHITYFTHHSNSLATILSLFSFMHKNLQSYRAVSYNSPFPLYCGVAVSPLFFHLGLTLASSRADFVTKIPQWVLSSITLWPLASIHFHY